jgi:hypothetical protein
LRPSYALVKSASGESRGAAAVGGGAADVVEVEGALLVVVAGDGLVALEAALVGAAVSWPADGALVHPVRSAPVRRSPTATRRIPIPWCHPDSSPGTSVS